MIMSFFPNSSKTSTKEIRTIGSVQEKKVRVPKGGLYIVLIVQPVELHYGPIPTEPDVAPPFPVIVIVTRSPAEKEVKVPLAEQLFVLLLIMQLVIEDPPFLAKPTVQLFEDAGAESTYA